MPLMIQYLRSIKSQISRVNSVKSLPKASLERWPGRSQSQPSKARTRCGPITSSRSNVPSDAPSPFLGPCTVRGPLKLTPGIGRNYPTSQRPKKLPLLWTCRQPPLQNSSRTHRLLPTLSSIVHVCQRNSQSFIHPTGSPPEALGIGPRFLHLNQQLSQYPFYLPLVSFPAD
jgi:hypothetical protein